jgi:hypothetical protein
MKDFSFQTPADKSRAYAALITPALVFADLLNGERAPLFTVEANGSQAGKGFFVRSLCAVYNDKAGITTKKENKGTGSMKETFDSFVVQGKSFISLDNLRGHLDKQWLESFLTESSYSARVPYCKNVNVDPSNIILFITSNGVELTKDQANRCCIFRIRKQPEGYKYQQFGEMDILGYIKANQPAFLGAVFTIVKEYFSRGCPRTDENRHDFRGWTRILDYIVQEICGQAPLLDDHRELQGRMCNSSTQWLRDVSLAVIAAGRQDKPLETHQIADIISSSASDVKLPGLPENIDYNNAADDQRSQVLMQLGKRLNSAFKDGDSFTIDGITITRTSEEHNDNSGRMRNYKKYIFHQRR